MRVKLQPFDRGVILKVYFPLGKSSGTKDVSPMGIVEN